MTDWKRVGQEYANRRNNLDYVGEQEVRFLKECELEGSILELGCGNGRLIGFFDGEETRTTGIDYSPKLLDIARKLYPKTKFIQQNLAEYSFLPYADNILAFEFFENIHKPTELIKEVANTARKKIVLSLFNRDNVAAKRIAIDENYSEWTAKHIVDEFETHKWIVKRIQGVFYYPLPLKVVPIFKEFDYARAKEFPWKCRYILVELEKDI